MQQLHWNSAACCCSLLHSHVDVQVRTLVRRQLNDALQQCDVLVGPSTSGPAFRLGSVVGDPLAMYKADMTTVALNLAGMSLCECSVSCVMQAG